MATPGQADKLKLERRRELIGARVVPLVHLPRTSRLVAEVAVFLLLNFSSNPSHFHESGVWFFHSRFASYSGLAAFSVTPAFCSG